jgi:hypothetical protein
VTIKTTVDARKEKIDADAAWDLLRQAESITVAKGKKIFTLDPKSIEKADILTLVMGPSGNLKAPTLRIRDRFMVGFNPDMVAHWLG